MPSQHQTDQLYLSIAHRVAAESYCQRRQVGCVIVTPTLATVIGYNGRPSGEPNVCELPDGTTDPRVIHAECNACLKADRHDISLRDATAYITLSPCVQCAELLAIHGVKRVVYSEQYRCTEGLQLLHWYGIVTEQMEQENPPCAPTQSSTLSA